jgi:hypothetical protein
LTVLQQKHLGNFEKYAEARRGSVREKSFKSQPDTMFIKIVNRNPDSKSLILIFHPMALIAIFGTPLIFWLHQ